MNVILVDPADLEEAASRSGWEAAPGDGVGLSVIANPPEQYNDDQAMTLGLHI